MDAVITQGDISHLFKEPDPPMIGTMTETKMEQQTPKQHFSVYKQQGPLVQVLAITPCATEAARYYKAGLQKRRSTVHLYWRV